MNIKDKLNTPGKNIERIAQKMSDNIIRYISQLGNGNFALGLATVSTMMEQASAYKNEDPISQSLFNYLKAGKIKPR